MLRIEAVAHNTQELNCGRSLDKFPGVVSRLKAVLEQFAAQVPARVISDLLGLPREDIPSFTKLVYNVSRFFSLSFTPDEIPSIEAATRQLQDYVERTLDRRRRAPCGDFLSRFVAAAAAAEMSPIEIIFQIVQLIVGGTDTTRVAIVMQVALRCSTTSDGWQCAVTPG